MPGGASGEIERACREAAESAFKGPGTIQVLNVPLMGDSGGDEGGSGGDRGGSGSSGGSGRGGGRGSGGGNSDGWLPRLWGMLAMGTAAGSTGGRPDLLALLPAGPLCWLFICWDALLRSVVASWTGRPLSRLPSYYPIPLPDAVAACAVYLTGAAKWWPRIPAEAGGTKLEEAPLTGRPRIAMSRIRLVTPKGVDPSKYEDEFFTEGLEDKGKWAVPQLLERY